MSLTGIHTKYIRVNLWRDLDCLQLLASTSKTISVADPGGVGGGVVGVITPLVAENFVCSNSNFSPTGAITPPPLAVPPGRHPPLQKILYPRLNITKHKSQIHKTTLFKTHVESIQDIGLNFTVKLGAIWAMIVILG